MKLRRLIAIALSVIILSWVVFHESAVTPLDEGEGTTVAEAISGEEAGYQRAFEPYVFSFPQDHGAHPAFRTEWWYFTGNLMSAAQRRFGYQLTIFRIALAPEIAERESAWASRNLYMGHLALSDVENRRFYRFERFSRDGLGLAGVEIEPFKLWLEDWQVLSTDQSFFPLNMRLGDGDISIELHLDASKPMVIQGDRGLSQKSTLPGNASYYYSYTRLQTQGHIKLKNQTIPVNGQSWLDREWSTSPLGEDQRGWDWFALQFEDGRELMYYQLRRKNGEVDSFSSGVLVSVNGEVEKITASQIELTVEEHWESAESGVRYPIRWRMRLPEHNLDLKIEAVMPNQEMNLSVRYWEGAVDIQSLGDSVHVRGRGYMELAGYRLP